MPPSQPIPERIPSQHRAGRRRVPGLRSARVTLLAALHLAPGTVSSAPAGLGPEHLEAIGRRIWRNECKGTREGLVHWNAGESFASLGIGHFLWFPPGPRPPFTESFPDLLRFLQEHETTLPNWLTPETPCPWRTREDWSAAAESPRLVALRDLLARTIGLQTRFVLDRFRGALPRMLASLPEGVDRERVSHRFQELQGSPEGLFALADYVNFKGEGTNPRERYQGVGWGLLQILLRMQGPPVGGPEPSPGGESAPGGSPPPGPLLRFRDACREVLRERVERSPRGRDRRWLRGWLRRCDGYLEPLR